MGRGKCLTEAEKIKIQIFYDSGKSVNQIAKEIGRSRHVVSNFIKNN